MPKQTPHSSSSVTAFGPSTEIKHLLLAIDFSRYSEIAYQHATSIAVRAGASVTLLHAAITENARPNAYELSTGQVETFHAVMGEQLERRRARLESMAQELRTRGVQAQAEIGDGPPARAISEAADRHGADLVIVGSHGHTGFQRLLVGSVAERVVRLCPCSVLVARAPVPSPDGFERVLVPTDFAPSADRALALAVALSADAAFVDLFHSWHLIDTVDASLEPSISGAAYASLTDRVLSAANERGKALLDRWASSGRTLGFHIAEGAPAASIQRFVEARLAPYDLIAVGTHGRTGLGRVLIGSVAERTVRHSPCSVLVARDRHTGQKVEADADHEAAAAHPVRPEREDR